MKRYKLKKFDLLRKYDHYVRENFPLTTSKKSEIASDLSPCNDTEGSLRAERSNLQVTFAAICPR